MGDLIDLSKRREARCPNCGSGDSVPILWGFPSPEAIAAYERCELMLGGCMPGDHKWFCKECEASWGPRTKRKRVGRTG